MGCPQSGGWPPRSTEMRAPRRWRDWRVESCRWGSSGVNESWMPQCSEQREIHYHQAHQPRDPGRRSHVLPAYPLENQKVENGWAPSSWFIWGSLSSFQIHFLPCWHSFSSGSRFHFLQPLCFELCSVVLCSMELWFLMPLPKTTFPR